MNFRPTHRRRMITGRFLVAPRETAAVNQVNEGKQTNPYAGILPPGQGPKPKK